MTSPAARKPPLWAWIAAVFVAAAILLALCNLQRTPLLASPAERSERLNLQRLRVVPAGALHVVALGTSKSLYAMDFDEAFVARLALHGRHAVFHRVTANEALFSDMEPALAAIADHPPDVLLLEDGLVLYDRNDQASLAGMLGRARKNLLTLRARLPGTPIDRMMNNNRGGEEWASATACRQSKTADALRAYAGYAGHWSTTTADQRTDYLSYLRAMRAAGTQLVLLNVPRAPSADRVVPPLLRQQAERLRAHLRDEEGFIAWSPGVMPESLYCDQVHVNRRGRAFFSAWLSKQLTDLLEHRHG